jgi:hypothetical protein
VDETPARAAKNMAKLNAATVKALALELFDYEFTDDAAASVAHIVGAMANRSRRLHGIGPTGTQPPFGFATLCAEADRLRRNS